MIEYDIAAFPNDGRTEAEPSVYDPRLLISEEVIPERLTMHGLSPMGTGRAGLFFARGWPTAPAKSDTTFFQFRLIIPPDYLADLDHITYAFGREDWAGVQGANAWELHVSYDAFDQHDLLLETIDTSGVADYFDAGDPNGALTVTTDLTQLGQRAGEVWFRWYGYDGSSSEMSEFVSGFINDRPTGSNVILDGQLSLVPEPGCLLLLGVAAAGLLRCRRA